MIPNPNVHLEYGMMMAFHKHVIPMQRDSENLPFNIYPIDTIKYNPRTFKNEAENAIDEIFLRLKIKEPPGHQAPNNVLKYYTFKGMRFSDVAVSPNRAVYNLGSLFGFNLFDGADGFVLCGNFPEQEPREIMVSVKHIIKNIISAYQEIATSEDNTDSVRQARDILDHISVDVLIGKEAPLEKMRQKINEFQSESHNIPINLLQPDDIDSVLEQEYESTGF